MLKQRMGVVFCLLCCSLFSACIIPLPVPGKEEVSPQMKGRIIDAQTKQPIVGVQVTVVDGPWSSGPKMKHRPTAATDQDGRFQLPADKRFYLVAFVTPGPFYHFPPVGGDTSTIAISHPDYESVQQDPHRLSQEFLDFGDIELARKK